jgi:hypothetical protein
MKNSNSHKNFDAGDFIVLFGAFVLIIVANHEKNIFPLLLAIFIIAVVVLFKLTKLPSSLDKEKLMGLGFAGGAIVFLIYGVIEGEFVLTLKLISSMAFAFYGLLEFLFTFVIKIIRGTKVEHYRIRLILSILSLLIGITSILYVSYKERTKIGLPMWESQKEFDMRKLRERRDPPEIKSQE